MEWGFDNARALAGIAVIFALAWAMSEDRRAFPWKIVLGAVALQFAFALVLFGAPPVRNLLFQANVIVDALEAATRAGTGFVFGYVGDNAAASDLMTGDAPPLFFFQILPIVIVVAALSAMLWHWRILRWVTKGFAVVFRRFMGLGGATSLAVSANVFMGMTEAPVLVKPYIKGMTRSELFIMMTTGFATIAGSVLIIYVTLLENAECRLRAARAAPDRLHRRRARRCRARAWSWCRRPLQGRTRPRAGLRIRVDHGRLRDRAPSDGLKIVLNIATMLIAALAGQRIARYGWGKSSPWRTAHAGWRSLLTLLARAGLPKSSSLACSTFSGPCCSHRLVGRMGGARARLAVHAADVHDRRAVGGGGAVGLAHGREDRAHRSSSPSSSSPACLTPR